MMPLSRYLHYLRLIKQSVYNNTPEVCKAQILGIAHQTLVQDARELRQQGLSVAIINKSLWRVMETPKRLANGKLVVAEDSMNYYSRAGKAYSKLLHPLAE